MEMDLDVQFICFRELRDMYGGTGIYVSEELTFSIHMYIYLFNEFIHRKGHVQHSEGSIIFYDYVF